MDIRTIYTNRSEATTHAALDASFRAVALPDGRWAVVKS